MEFKMLTLITSILSLSECYTFVFVAFKLLPVFCIPSFIQCTKTSQHLSKLAQKALTYLALEVLEQNIFKGFLGFCSDAL